MMNFDADRVRRMTKAERDAVRDELNYASELVNVRIHAWTVAPQRPQQEWLAEVPSELAKRAVPNVVVQEERDTVLSIIQHCTSSRDYVVGGEGPLDRCLRILNGRLAGVMLG